MRNKLRIPIILDFFKNNKEAFESFTLAENGGNHDIFLENFDDIKTHWLDNQDLRFGQMLINLGIIPDSRVWNIETDHWLVLSGHVEPEEIFTWTSHYDAEGNRLEQSKTVLLKDLTTDHITNILSFVDIDRLHMWYLNYFNRRIDEG